MTKPFHIEAQHINRLDDIQLTQLLKLLLHAEADKHGIAQQAINVALNIKVGDGGEDGRIEWLGEPASTDYLPNHLTQFQNKAVKKLEPAICANELETKEGAIVPMVLDVLTQGGSYILFTTKELNKKQKQKCIAAMKKRLTDLNFTNAATADIHIYDASMIAGWVNHFLSAIVSVLNWIGEPIERGLKPFSAWKTIREFEQYPFVDAEARKQAIIDFRKLLKEPRKCARIVGLSGLGKTRTAFEIFKGDDFLQELVIYIDDMNVPNNVAALLSDWVSHGLKGIIVVDNCEAQLHEQLQKEISRTDSQLSLLTLDYNLDKVSNTTVRFDLMPLPTPEIKEMLEKIYVAKILDLDRIAEFAQGFPQMAVLIADARLENDPNIGLLTNDVIAEKLLWGRSKPDKCDEIILKACALFDRFGVDEKPASELDFIATQIAEVSSKDFYECVQRFTEKRIIDRRGRYAHLVPKPLAIRLAAQWWTRTRPQDQTNLIDSLPESLVESFCNQIEKLDFLPEVKTLTESLCGCQSPFGQAEVILSTRGSRLFRSFVNVNPKATTSALSRVLQNQTHEQRLNITGDVRRNLVWALEKLCFHADIFENAAWCLLLLASAENESYSNNAQGIFSQLFRVFNSGTAATLAQRIFIIKKAIEMDDIHFIQVILKSLDTATDTFGGMRTIGAEYQGTKPPLQEWKPKLWQEIFDYWQSCFDFLTLQVEKDNSVSEQAKNIIGHSIRGLMQNGRIEMLDKAIKQVIAIKGKYWLSALDSIKTTLEYDTKEMPVEGVDALNSWLNLLTPDKTNIEDQLNILVVNPPWENRKGNDGHYIDVAAEKAEHLANELSADINIINEHLLLLLKGEQKKSFWFGRALAIKADDVSELLQNMINILSTIENPNSNFARGLLSGIYQKSVDNWNNYLEVFSSTPALIKFYPEMICTGTIEPNHLNKLLSLIKNNQLSPLGVLCLSYGSVTNHLIATDMSSFCLELSKIDSDSNWVALDIMFMYCHGDDAKFDAIKETLKIVVTSAPLNKYFRGGHSDMYHWESIVSKISKTDGLDFAKAVCQQILLAVDDKLDYGDIKHYIRPVLIAIMSSYGEELWSLFGEKIINANSIKRHELSSLIGRDIRFGDKKSKDNIFSVLPLELVINWCNENKKIAPYFVAISMNIFEQEDNQKQPSQLFIEILEKFGNLESLGQQLSANLATRSWSGSLVPYLESDKSALTPLLEHSNQYVRSWVSNYIANLDKQINYESKQDEEHDWGIY